MLPSCTVLAKLAKDAVANGDKAFARKATDAVCANVDTEEEAAVIEPVILFTTYDPLKNTKFSSISAMVSFLPKPSLKVIAIFY
jgi:hypothetical protein